MNLPLPDSHKYQKLFVILIIAGSLLSGCKHKHPSQYNYGHITDSISRFDSHGEIDTIIASTGKPIADSIFSVHGLTVYGNQDTIFVDDDPYSSNTHLDSIGLGGKLYIDTIPPSLDTSKKLTMWRWQTDVWDNKNVQDPVTHKMTFWQKFFFTSGIIAWICPFVLMGLLMWTDRNIAKEKEAQLRKEEAFQKSQAFKDTKEIYDELHKKDFK